MIKKITVLYLDGTYEDVDQEYFKNLDKMNQLSLDDKTVKDHKRKDIREVCVYYFNGQYTKVSELDNTKVK